MPGGGRSGAEQIPTPGRGPTRFEGREEEKGQWTARRELPMRWTVALGGLRFELKRTDFGHVGLFPEQVENWAWIRRRGERRGERGEGEGSGFRVQGSDSASRPSSFIPHPSSLKILNLFAYTGGSTLAAAAAGAEVVHVDAAKNIVGLGTGETPTSTGLADAPIHWIVEEAQKFVKRELRRGSRYDGVILDPPSYGHGPRGEVWRLSTATAAAAFGLRRVDGRPPRVRAIDVPHPRLWRGGAP